MFPMAASARLCDIVVTSMVGHSDQMAPQLLVVVAVAFKTMEQDDVACQLDDLLVC